MAKKQKKLTPKRERKLIKAVEAARNSGKPLVESRITIDPQSTFVLSVPVTVEKGRRLRTAADTRGISLVDYINEALDDALAREEVTRPPLDVSEFEWHGPGDSAPYPDLPSRDVNHPTAIGAG